MICLRLTRGKTLAILAFFIVVLAPLAYIYATQGLSSENVATGDGYALVLTLHRDVDPNRQYYTVRVKRGSSPDIKWIYVEGNGLARNITNYSYIEDGNLTPSITGAGGEFGFGIGERLWRDGDRVHLILKVRGKTLDLGTILVRTTSLQADDYLVLAAYVLLLAVVAILLFPRLSAFLDIATSRAPISQLMG